MIKSSKCILFILILIGCSKDQKEEINMTPKFAECEKLLNSCNSAEGDYCLFGFKWGIGNNFMNSGINAEGPKIQGGIISYSFQEKQTSVSTDSEDDVPTESFNELPDCAKQIINQAFQDWSAVANIQFEELPEDSESDIKLFVVSLVNSGGNGFPNFVTSPCQMLAGHILLHPDITSDCNLFYPYVLHEIGHSLGLGHSSENNVMGSIYANLDGIQEGDINGIRQIYGQ